MIRWPHLVAFALAVLLSATISPPRSAHAQSATTQAPDAAANESTAKTYSKEEVLQATKTLFGDTTKGLAEVIEKVFSDLGQPNAYIAGEEFSGAIGVGLRYGEGTLMSAGGGSTKVYWQGPSIGFDLGGNASKVFVLVYNLKSPDGIFRRIPGVEGTYYFIAGVGVNYQSDGDITLAPIRTGVGLRSGVNIGYLHYNREFSWLPF